MAISVLSLLAGCTILVFAIYKFVVYPALLSPLAKIPNAHFSSSISPAWILWTRFRARNNVTTYNAHRRYGPIIRLAPNELSINCVDGGLRTVYTGGMEKPRWYEDQFSTYGVINMFSTMGRYDHSAKKRMLSNLYSKSFLQSSPQIAENAVVLLRDRFLPLLQRAAEQSTALEVHEMNNSFTMDFMSAYLFGIANSTNFSTDVVKTQRFLQAYHGRRPYEFFAQEMASLMRFTKQIGLHLIPKSVDDGNRGIEAWGLDMCDGANAYLNGGSSPGEEPIVYRQLKTSMEKNQGKNPDVETADRTRLEIASEMLDHVSAGHETSAVALTYLQWEMSRRPELQQKLRDEVLTLSPRIVWPPKAKEEFDLPSSKSVDGLPLLQAIVLETLRLHSPIPGMQPRLTPADGCTLAGYTNIPPNVRVSAMAYALHRNEDVFPEPERWNVERWLKPADSPDLKEMMRWFWAFGSGGRMCIGSNLAMQEMKLLVAAVYSNYTTSIINDEKIEALDTYTTRPRSNQLILRFTHV